LFASDLAAFCLRACNEPRAFWSCTNQSTVAYTSQDRYAGYMNLMFVDLVNSEWYDGLGNLDDRLENPEWLKAFATKWGLGSADPAAPSGEIDRYFAPRRLESSRRQARRRRAPAQDLRDLRSLLRSISEWVTVGQPVRPRDLTQLNQHLRRAPVRYRVDDAAGQLRLVREPLADDGQWLLGAVALSAAEFLATGDRTRLKICHNEGCRWVFIDDSKNRSRRWCDSASCGNLFKVRRYRERQRSRR
jgi:predicted RNA-binding Zn ribbon-like protein